MNVKISSPTSQTLSKEEFLKFVEYAKVFNADGSQTNTPCTFSFDGAYTDEIDKFKEMFPNVDVSALIAYIRFKDSNVSAYLLSKGIGTSDGITIEQAEAVTNVGVEWFYQNTDITSFDELKYFKNITYLGRNAFCGCTNLKSISLDNITSLGSGAFRGCAFEELIIPGTLNPSNGFVGCTKLKRVIIEDGQTTISNTFVYEESLIEVKLPNTLVTLDYCFVDCIVLPKVILPNSIRYLTGANSFRTFKGSVYYDGTLAEFDNVEIASDWNTTKTVKVIHCKDGDFTRA